MVKWVKNYSARYFELYGALGIASAAAVLVKMILFYGLIGTITGIGFVLFLSCLLIGLLFAAFRNKWIPASIYAAASILMVCDATYASFFNRYLSVNMLGAAAFLGDITASIAEVFRPMFLLLLADVVLIFVCLAIKRVREKKKDPGTENMMEAEMEKETETAPSEEIESEKKKVLPQRIKRLKKNKTTAGKFILAHKCGVSAVLILLLFTVNIFGSSFIKSVSNQEILTYHIKDIGMKALGMTAGESLAAFTDSYAKEKNGPLFGAAKGRNLIVIQVESFQNFVIGLSYNGQEITPNLNKLLEGNTTYFNNYHQQIGVGNTSDAEFATNNSIMGSLLSYTYKLYGDKNYFRGLPVLLKEKGYDTAVFHAHENKEFWNRENAYPNLGFNAYYGGLKGEEGDGAYTMRDWMGWGLTDNYFFEQTVDYMEELKEPFYSFVITLSNHHPYQMLDKYSFIDLKPEDEGTIVGNYLNSAAFTDYALGLFMDDLKAKGLYENSVIALYGDHVGLTHSEEIDASMEKLLGRPYDFDTMMNIPLIITLPNSEANIKGTVSTAGGQLDFLPTIAYLLGFNQLDTLYLGHNLYTVEEGLVAEQTYMTKGSFFKNDIAYEMARDGVFEHGRAWKVSTGETVPLSKCYDDYVRSMDVVNTSEYILRSDAIRRIYLDGEDARTAFNAKIAKPYPEAIAMAGWPDEELLGKNNLDAIEKSYEYGYHDIRVIIDWTEKSEPVALDSETGEVLMTYEELIDWMEDHADTNIVADIQRSGDYFIRFMSEKSPAIAERLILELPELAEYSGKHDAIIDLTQATQSPDEIKDFIERNKVWAVMMTREDAVGRFAGLVDIGTAVYIIGEEDGLITKTN